MHGIGVGGGMHRDGRDAKLLARAQNAQGDLAAIGYQDFVEHVVLGSEWRKRKSIRNSPLAIRALTQ
jgi:hypothetical protein